MQEKRYTTIQRMNIAVQFLPMHAQSLDGMTIIRDPISILRWRETVRLSARTAGEMDLEKTEFSMCPTTIRILARIMWHIHLHQRTSMTLIITMMEAWTISH